MRAKIELRTLRQYSKAPASSGLATYVTMYGVGEHVWPLLSCVK